MSRRRRLLSLRCMCREASAAIYLPSNPITIGKEAGSTSSWYITELRPRHYHQLQHHHHRPQQQQEQQQLAQTS